MANHEIKTTEDHWIMKLVWLAAYVAVVFFFLHQVEDAVNPWGLRLQVYKNFEKSKTEYAKELKIMQEEAK